MSRKNPRTTLAQRSAAVRRIFAGEYYEVIAAEFNVNLQTVHDWVRCWRTRVGSWHNEPLEPVEEQLGFKLEKRYFGGTLMGASVVVPEAQHLVKISDEREHIEQFLQFLGKLPLMDSELFERAYKRLGPDSQARLEPAFDAYQRAIEHAVELRRFRALALELATRELAEQAEHKAAA